MFIETILVSESGSPFMGAMKSVPLLKEFPTIDLFFRSINISPLRGFVEESFRRKFFHILNFLPKAGTSNANFKISS